MTLGRAGVEAMEPLAIISRRVMAHPHEAAFHEPWAGRGRKQWSRLP